MWPFNKSKITTINKAAKRNGYSFLQFEGEDTTGKLYIVTISKNIEENSEGMTLFLSKVKELPKAATTIDLNSCTVETLEFTGWIFRNSQKSKATELVLQRYTELNFK